jgi:PTH2 family peptidyl-tRNA hydrolase
VIYLTPCLILLSGFMLKQVIVVRRDLKLSPGKLAVQVAHASLEAYRRSDPKSREAWESSGAKKVVVKVPDLESLLDVHERAGKLKLARALIKDAGRTELPPGTITALGIGPSPPEKMDRVTRELKLL